ncbi:MAG: amino acid permease, partial [Acidobacteriota bacterium]
MADSVGFRRDIGLFLAVMIGIGAMMGPGIFALPGVVAGMLGPLGVLVYLVMGGLTVFTALNYSELGAAIPLAGGGYSFTSRTLPRPLAFLTGWFFWIGNTLACAMYAVVFALTVRAYFWPGASMALIAVVVAATFTALNVRSMSEAIKVITVMNLIELLILVGIALLGVFDVEAPNLTPVAPLGWAPFVPAMALIYISYVGFELITVASEEIINPGKTIPRAILITLLVATVIYVFVVWVMMGTVHYEELAGSEVPFIFTAERLFGGWGRWAGIIATVMASLSAFSVTLGASARVLYALGRDGHLPYRLATLHRRYRTPHIALLLCALVVVLFASSGIIEFVASMSDFGYLMGLGLVNLAVIALQSRMPNLRRPFRVALYPAVPVIGALSCWIFVPALEGRSFVLGGLMTLAGAAVYLSKAGNRNEILEIRDRVARRLYLIRHRKKARMHVVIIGGGAKGRSIAGRLLAEDEVRLMFRSTE